MKKIYVIHENETWLVPLRAAFKELGLPYEEWNIDKMTLDLSELPPDGVFYNRMSASAHTRDHRYAPEFTNNLLAWLERHGRTVINGWKALQLEVRKSEQCLALQEFGIKHPRTLIANDESLLPKLVDKLHSFPFILKPNRGGKGTGVQMFYSKESLQNAIENRSIGESLDGIWLVQEYIKPVNGRVTRVEFVGGEFLYAVSIDASGGFELCPADSCQIGDSFCPTTDSEGSSKFIVLDDYENSNLESYGEFLKKNDIGVGALEYAEDELGNKYVYDVNTNTNYNAAAELKNGKSKRGMLEIARHLGRQLEDVGCKMTIRARA